MSQSNLKKPHELIEVIVTMSCKCHMIHHKQLMTYTHQYRTKSTSNRKALQEARYIVAALISKYLGRDFAAEIMMVSRDAIDQYIAIHNGLMKLKRRAYNVTNKIIDELTKDEFTPAAQYEYDAINLTVKSRLN